MMLAYSRIAGRLDAKGASRRCTPTVPRVPVDGGHHPTSMTTSLMPMRLRRQSWQPRKPRDTNIWRSHFSTADRRISQVGVHCAFFLSKISWCAQKRCEERAKLDPRPTPPRWWPAEGEGRSSTRGPGAVSTAVGRGTEPPQRVTSHRLSSRRRRMTPQSVTSQSVGAKARPPTAHMPAAPALAQYSSQPLDSIQRQQASNSTI